MLVLTRRVGEKVHIGDNVTVTLVKIEGDRVRLGFEAPDGISIYRNEIADRFRDLDIEDTKVKVVNVNDRHSDSAPVG